MAVGDGANDVNMITTAHVGVGVRGVEGNQAAKASDYAIGEFSGLNHLLLYYGREYYRRNTNLVGYNFYKNIVVVLPIFWYSFNNGFSATNLYDPWLYQFYNLFYTSVPIVLYCLIDDEYKLQHIKPSYYSAREPQSLSVFFAWLF
jgi:phospholipid-transporting ATPase